MNFLLLFEYSQIARPVKYFEVIFSEQLRKDDEKTLKKFRFSSCVFA
jgi:hypothetical protein